MITIKVDVYEGAAPVPINVLIDNVHNSDDIRIKRNKSFEESFNLVPGEYTIIISGQNPAKGKTEIFITGKDSNGKPIIQKVVNEDHLYSHIFKVYI